MVYLDTKHVVEQFAIRRRRQLTSGLVLVVFGIVVFGLKTFSGSEPIVGLSASVLMGGLIAALVIYVFFSLYNWRCPGCNAYLGKVINPKFCPKCGVQLQE